MTRTFITTLLGMILLAAITAVFLSGAKSDALASTGIQTGAQLLEEIVSPANL
ncbi:MAG: hypothetical protein AAGH60_09730 [Pseudomonadota bacterium]